MILTNSSDQRLFHGIITGFDPERKKPFFLEFDDGTSLTLMKTLYTLNELVQASGMP